uniref:Adenine nucleotide translocase lysine methyltransferase n=1 Tax=Canis lupus familiaris TaxID=9615 RepID=A0A8C0NDN6_CANLF
MEPDEPGEALTELRERRLGALGLLQAAAGSGLAAYAVWALLLQPGFRAVPLRLQVRGGADWGAGPGRLQGQGWGAGPTGGRAERLRGGGGGGAGLGPGARAVRLRLQGRGRGADGALALPPRGSGQGTPPLLLAQVPYVGASARQVEHVLTLLRGRPGKTVDLGSGDGRIVLAAHRCGLRPALGYELNPWLVGLARLHAWRAGCAGSVRFCCQDLWKVNLRDCHNVSVFLAPSVVGRGAGAAARPRGGPGQPRSTGRTWVGGRSPPVLCTLPPALSHSSRCWKTSCRQSCPKGPEWCRGAFLSPLGSLWPCWVRVWTASGPMTSIVVAQLVRSPQDPVLPQSLGPPLLWLADYLDTIKTQRTTS